MATIHLACLADVERAEAFGYLSAGEATAARALVRLDSFFADCRDGMPYETAVRRHYPQDAAREGGRA